MVSEHLSNEPKFFGKMADSKNGISLDKPIAFYGAIHKVLKKG
jgi:hypothetical protein